MKQKRAQDGFTLVEVLVSASLVLIIVSIVYGSYFAVSKSAGLGERKLRLSEQILTILTKMDQQLRCCYVPQTEGAQDKKILGRPFFDGLSGSDKSADGVNYFKGQTKQAEGTTVRFITAKQISAQNPQGGGLFEICYRFDYLQKTLSVSQTRFLPAAEAETASTDFNVLFTNLSDMKLRFYDGQSWAGQWDWLQSRQLPVAVEIVFFVEDRLRQESMFENVTYIPCRALQNTESTDKKILF